MLNNLILVRVGIVRLLIIIIVLVLLVTLEVSVTCLFSIWHREFCSYPLVVVASCEFLGRLLGVPGRLVVISRADFQVAAEKQYSVIVWNLSRCARCPYPGACRYYHDEKDRFYGGCQDRAGFSRSAAVADLGGLLCAHSSPVALFRKS